MEYTGRLNLWKLVFGGGTPEVPINESLSLLDGMVWPSVKDRDLSAPPGSPTTGACYLVAASPTGAWAGKANHIAVYVGGGAWRFAAPVKGAIVWIEDEHITLRYYTSSWLPVAGTAIIERYNSSNVSVGSTMTLLTHDTSTEHDTGVYGLDADNGGIVLLHPGRYRASVDLTLTSSVVSAGNTIDAKLTLDGVDVAGSKGSCNLGAVNVTRDSMHISVIIVPSAANSVIRAYAQRASGTSTINALAEGWRFRIESL